MFSCPNNIISHRGMWITSSEKNTMIAFDRALRHGFGIETDVRDLNGDIVISHDMPLFDSANILLEDLLILYFEMRSVQWLALNIKSDGLQEALKLLLDRYQITNYFLFDMSVPDAIISNNKRLQIFTRQSEHEIVCSLYKDSIGVWLDEFGSDWISDKCIEKHLNNGKKVCLVSPELHGRKHMRIWNIYKDFSNNGNGEVFICTDFPEDLQRLLYE